MRTKGRVLYHQYTLRVQPKVYIDKFMAVDFLQLCNHVTVNLSHQSKFHKSKFVIFTPKTRLFLPNYRVFQHLTLSLPERRNAAHLYFCNSMQSSYSVHTQKFEILSRVHRMSMGTYRRLTDLSFHTNLSF